MVHHQNPDSQHDRTHRFYAYCIRPRCGVCGPIRFSYTAALADSDAHDAVCEMAKALAAT